jgi:uridylate kinase
MAVMEQTDGKAMMQGSGSVISAPRREPGTKMNSPHPVYKRVLLKLSGEALMGKEGFGIDPQVIAGIADEIANAHRRGVQMAVVVGGGNIFRGVKGSSWGMDKAAADYVGMLATIMNCLILQEVLNAKGVATRVQTAIAMPAVAEPFIRLRAIRHLEKGRIVIFGGGTGNPHVTTDTAAALRAAEIKAELILMAKNQIDGVYSADPRTNPDAHKITAITFDEMIRQNLRVMDPAAVSLSEQNNIPIVVFDFGNPGSVEKIVTGDKSIGTWVTRS